MTLRLKWNSYTVPEETAELNFNWKSKDPNLPFKIVLDLALENGGRIKILQIYVLPYARRPTKDYRMPCESIFFNKSETT